MSASTPDDRTSNAFGAGMTLGAYRIESELGRGGMGVVYKAVHTVLNKPVAIKVMGVAFAANQQAIERLLAEGRALAKLQHPNVVSITDCGEFNGLPYLVLEFLEGGTVETLLQRQGGRLPPAEVKRILEDLLAGLKAAHDANIIHRDIKPSNLLVDGQGRIRISDFGLAQAFQGGDVTVVDRTIFASSPTVTSLQTSVGSSSNPVGGTIQFMAPELHGMSTGDARSDIFAVGVMTYYLLTGRKPAGKFAEASALVAGLPRDWDAFIDKCIAQQADDRFQTAGEALAAVHHLGRPQRQPKSGLRLGLALAAVVALGVGGWVLLHRGGSGGGGAPSTPMIAKVRFINFADGDELRITCEGYDRTVHVFGTAPRVVDLQTKPTRVRAMRADRPLFDREFDLGEETQWTIDLAAVLDPNRGPGRTPSTTAVPATVTQSPEPPPSPAPATAPERMDGRMDLRFEEPVPAAAEVWVDGVLRQTLAAGARFEPLDLAAGTHQVEVRGPGLRTARADVDITEAQLTTTQLRVERLSFDLVLEGLPVGATGKVGNESFTVPATGLVKVKVPYGRHALTIEAPLHEPYGAELEVTGSRTLTPPLAWQKIVRVSLPGGLWLDARLLEPGEYEVGARRDDPLRQPSDLDRRRFRLEAPCYLALTELTQQQYEAIRQLATSDGEPVARATGAALPVESVSGREILGPRGLLALLNRWSAAEAPILVADLPNEYEWEIACRAGADNPESNLGAGAATPESGLADVAAGQPNPWGFRWLLGNVAEMTRLAPAEGADSDGTVVLRGGHWQSGPAGLRPQSRIEVGDDLRRPATGLRLAFRLREPRP